MKNTAYTIRDEYEYNLLPIEDVVHAVKTSWIESVWDIDWVRQAVILFMIGVLWETFARFQNNSLLVPPLGAIGLAIVEDLSNGILIEKTIISLSILVQGYLLGIVIALSLTVVAISTRFGRDILSTLTAMFSPLPPIALLPLALLWFGLGKGSLIFVLIHSVMWPLALNTYTGFRGVPNTLRMAGANYGLTGLRFVFLMLIPAALPSIISGLKIGWAFAWRTLIAAELVFGASTGKGGLGWYIFQNRNELYTDRVFAGLVLVILIGLLVERIVFETIEKLTIRRWGVVR